MTRKLCLLRDIFKENVDTLIRSANFTSMTGDSMMFGAAVPVIGMIIYLSSIVKEQWKIGTNKIKKEVRAAFHGPAFANPKTVQYWQLTGILFKEKIRANQKASITNQGIKLIK